MAEQQKIEKQSAKRKDETATPEGKKDDKLVKALDEIIDSIDDVLYENAEAFVSSFTQKGGQ